MDDSVTARPDGRARPGVGVAAHVRPHARARARHVAVAVAALVGVARPGIAAAQTSFSFTIENNSGQDWSAGLIALLPDSATPDALLEPGAAPTSGDQYAAYGFGHRTCDTVVSEGDTAGLAANFTGLTLGDNAFVVPALSDGATVTVSVLADPGEVLSFVAYVSGTDDDVVLGHETGDTADVTIALFDEDDLPLPDAAFDISGFDTNSAASSSGDGLDCSSSCAPPAVGCFVAFNTGSIGSGAGTASTSDGAFDFDVALWTRTETGFTTDTLAVGDVVAANPGDEIIVLMQGGIYYEGTGSVGAGKTVVLNQDGTLIKTYAPGAGRDIMGPVTIADIDGVAPSEYLIGEALSRAEGGSLLAISADTPGVDPPSLAWAQTPRGYPGYWNLGTTVADVTGDSTAEIVSPSFEGVLQVLTASTGALADEIDLFATYGERHYGHASVADIDGDGTNEIALVGYTLGQVIVLQSDGDADNDAMTELFLSDVNSANGVAFGSGPAVANIDDDDELEIIVALTNTAGDSTGYVRAYDMVNGPGTGCEYEWTVAGVQGFRWVSPVVGDVDGDGTNEIVMQGNSGKLSVLSTEGVAPAASCSEGAVEATSYVGGSWSWFTPGLANLVGDSALEIVAAGYEVLEVLEMLDGDLAVKYRATEPAATFYASPIITAGIDGAFGPAARITVNGWLNGVIYQYGTQNTDNTPADWTTFGGVNGRTGSASEPVFGGAFQQDPGTEGLVSIQAEDYDDNVSPAGATDDWVTESTIGGASPDLYMITTPIDSTINNTNYAALSPRLDYRVNFNQAGDHYVWIRAHANSGTTDSVHVGVNNAENTTADRIQLGSGSWIWSGATMDAGARAVVNIPSPGVHTINLWMREDGAPVDKIVLTTDSSYTPADNGPDESTTPVTGGAFEQSTDAERIVSMQAENYHDNVTPAGTTDNWVSDSSIAGASPGQYVIATPVDFSIFNTNYAANSPRLDYRINFNRAGDHYVWIRAHANNGNTDSVHVGLNNVELATADRISNFSSGSWSWSSTTMDSNARAVINVPSAGVHTLNLWMREDGTPVDKIVLTTDSSFTPTGSGPTESLR